MSCPSPWSKRGQSQAEEAWCYSSAARGAGLTKKQARQRECLLTREILRSPPSFSTLPPVPSQLMISHHFISIGTKEGEAFSDKRLSIGALHARGRAWRKYCLVRSPPFFLAHYFLDEPHKIDTGYVELRKRNFSFKQISLHILSAVPYCSHYEMNEGKCGSN